MKCPACGEDLCENCRECHNVECERYVQPSDTCEIKRQVAPATLGDEPGGYRQAEVGGHAPIVLGADKVETT